MSLVSVTTALCLLALLPPPLPRRRYPRGRSGNTAVPTQVCVRVRAVRVTRWFKLIESIHLRDAYDPLRSHLYNPHSHFHLKHAQRPRGKPTLLTHPLLCASLAPCSALDLIMSYIFFPAAAMMEGAS